MLVPVGTVVESLDGEVLCDLMTEGDRWLAAEGGRGGMGNARFLSNRRRAPAFAEQGEVGQETWFNLELKLVADVALVGFPNVGKSTLIASVSAAKPKIADYPFTTLIPNLGVVRVGGEYDMTEFVMADIPGLIEGAAEGKGLGHQFLRHIERARVLVILLDLAEPDGRSLAEQEAVLLRELEDYQPDLIDRPRLRVASRSDLVPDVEMADGDCDLVISSVTRRGLDELVGRLATMVAQARRVEEGPSMAIKIHRPAERMVSVVRHDDGAFEVLGRAAERAVRFSNLTDDGALDEAVRRLEKLGVARMLRQAGIGEGAKVIVGDVEFDWWMDKTMAGLSPEDLPRRPHTKRAAR